MVAQATYLGEGNPRHLAAWLISPMPMQAANLTGPGHAWAANRELSGLPAATAAGHDEIVMAGGPSRQRRLRGINAGITADRRARHGDRAPHIGGVWTVILA
jgi:hypothetical protein